MSRGSKIPKSKTRGRPLRKANRVFTQDFKIEACKRLLAGMSVRQLSQELRIQRTVLYRWRDAYQQHGAAALHGRPGPPRKTPVERQAEVEASKDRKIANLERTVGQQAMEIRFLRLASKRLEESRRNSTSAGGTASTPPSGK